MDGRLVEQVHIAAMVDAGLGHVDRPAAGGIGDDAPVPQAQDQGGDHGDRQDQQLVVSP